MARCLHSCLNGFDFATSLLFGFCLSSTRRTSRANSLHNFDELSRCYFNWKKAAWSEWPAKQVHWLGASRSGSQPLVADSSGFSAG